MLDIGASELLLLGVVALVVLGPEKLPHVARLAGAWMGKIRRTMSTLQAEIEREVEAQELKARLEKEYKKISESSALSDLKESAATLEHEVRNGLHTIGDEKTGAPESPIAASLENTAENISEKTHEISAEQLITGSAESAALKNPNTHTLQDAAIAPEKIELNGEQAYREWLAAQKTHRILPPATDSSPS